MLDFLSSLPFTLGELDMTAGSFQTWLSQETGRRQDLDILNKPQILLGAGSVLAQDFVSHMLSRGRVIALVDNVKAGQSLNGVPYIGDTALKEVLDRESEAIGILCCGSENAINHFRQVWGTRPHPLAGYFEVISRLPDIGVAGYWLSFLPKFSEPALIHGLHEKAKDAFNDRLSRQTLDAIMLYRLTWDDRFIAAIARPEKAIYFEPDVMPLTDREVFVDGGAYDGDTVRAFLSQAKGRYNHIHAFEIDPVNANTFTGKMQDIDRVTLHRTGLWHETAEMGLEHRSDNGSRISHHSAITVPLNAMDNMDLGDVSLIKLDIEGAENQALQGARTLIQTHKPKLAICAYHKADDFSTIIYTINDLRDDYRLALRHYSPILFDSVIYAL